ncbi:MAG: phosphoethanolamine transferase [Prevotellaceae bacterium]|nr:phosphoethanolamine transferase [Candidatus Minthosoma caballi]
MRLLDKIGVRRSWRLLLFTLTACILGYYVPEGKLSFHCFTASVATTVLLSLPIGLLPRYIRMALQFIVGEAVIFVCLVDVYCQIHLLSGITPHLFTAVFLTDMREASEFFQTYLKPDIIENWRILLLLSFIVLLPLSMIPPIGQALYKQVAKIQIKKRTRSIITILMGCCAVISIALEAVPMYHFLQFFSPDCDPQDTEGLIFRRYHEEVSTPIHRILQAWSATIQSKTMLASIELATLNAQIDSCSYRSPYIVLVIGESYNKHHSSLYDYALPTTPLQEKRQAAGELFVFDDVVTPWNITSNVFLNMFSTWNCSSELSISECPLFPALFRRAGYEVAFFSNQYVMRGLHKTSTNQAGFFFLTNMTLCDTMFDYRNEKAYGSDLKFLKIFEDYQNGNREKIKGIRGMHTRRRRHEDKNTVDNMRPKLDIIHLVGQHFDYKNRYPEGQGRFTDKDVLNRSLTKEERQTVMHYDNATHYDDMVLNKILSLYEDEDAVVVFVADHGEEIYDDQHVMGRLFQTPTWQIAHQEYEVPMWIWCSAKYQAQHGDVVECIKQALHRPLLTDDVSQLLFDLAGIQCHWRDDKRNVLSEKYEPKQRIIAGETDYDALKKVNNR